MDRTDAVFGDRIRRLRLDLALSQEALADHAGLHRTYISLIERGQRSVSLSTIMKLSVALGVTAADLLADLEHDLSNACAQRTGETALGN